MPEVFTDAERLKGFYKHKKEAKEFDKERMSAVQEVKAERERWAAQLKKGLPEYRKQKELEKKLMDEMSEAFVFDEKDKKEVDLQSEKARKKYIAERDAARNKQKSTVRLTEEEEYEVPDKRERVDVTLRALYGAKTRFSKNSSATGSAGGSSGGGYVPPSNDFIPPPPPPEFSAPPEFSPPTEFFEPEIPPPPPSFDDMPPPIFDEPEF